jgi:hypothetical protein
MRVQVFLILALSAFMGQAFSPRCGKCRVEIPMRAVMSKSAIGKVAGDAGGTIAPFVSFMKKEGVPLNILSVLGTVGRRVAMMTAVWFSFLAKKVHAAGAIRGWDMYGRVPYDDWLFSTWSLTDPNLLRSSLTEAISNELPTVLHAFRRRKRINEITVSFTGIGVVAVCVVLMGTLYRSASFANSRNAKRRALGSVSAISKKGQKKGKNIDDMGEGWVDMDDDMP